MLTGHHHRGRALWALSCTILFMAFLATPGCSPRIVEKVVHQHDTTEIHHRDSIYRRDSVWMREYVKGDTIYLEKYRDRILYRDRWRDSIVVRGDSVTVEAVKEVKVEKPLNAWQRFRIGSFWWLLALAAVGWRKQILRLVRKIAGLFG